MPPVVGSESIVDPPIHTFLRPDMGDTADFTVTNVVAVQPDPVVKVIVAVPGVIPVTTPDDGPMLAMAGLLLLQLPPPKVPSLSVVELPTHKVVFPLIGDTGFTLITCEAVETSPQASVEVTMYVVVAAGVSVTVVPVSPPGVQV